MTEKNFIIHYKDDGRGLQLRKLKQVAIDSNKWHKDEIQSWDKTQLTHVIFTPGISSAEKTDHLSGRGVGMDLIKDQLQKYNGKIEVDSIETEYCKFTIILPLINEN
jgi:two-component system chemotaxis sensor kinase CheA